MKEARFQILIEEPTPLEYLRELSPLIEALHSTVFGVHALEDPNFSHEALGDRGQIHVLIHHILRALPSKLYLKDYDVVREEYDKDCEDLTHDQFEEKYIKDIESKLNKE